MAELRDRALACLVAARFDEASELIAEAFAIVDGEGGANHIAFASLLGVAADVALTFDVESAIPLYNRLYQCAEANGHRVLMANALRGIGEVHLLRGAVAHAHARFERALELLRDQTQPDAVQVRGGVVSLMESLERHVGHAHVS